ncbi:hypothetical protein [Ralstonia solanacearum]|uniref:hypothetical protein n=1 Tax=Ralstonia solanacearum TaxID=305 RepID=UPI0009C09A3E|nr:hypothetical protein [Ralstonia solanacearum]
MSHVLRPIEVLVDDESDDDGFFSVVFTFNFDVSCIPHNIGLCRDEFEDPGVVYIEPDDQIHGFKTQNVSFSINDLILSISLLDENRFYWDGSKEVRIQIDPEDLVEVEKCMRKIFDLVV